MDAEHDALIGNLELLVSMVTPGADRTVLRGVAVRLLSVDSETAVRALLDRLESDAVLQAGLKARADEIHPQYTLERTPQEVATVIRAILAIIFELPERSDLGLIAKSIGHLSGVEFPRIPA